MWENKPIFDILNINLPSISGECKIFSQIFSLPPGTGSRPSRGGRSRSGERLACRGAQMFGSHDPPRC
jgi:hypothetical protein